MSPEPSTADAFYALVRVVLRANPDWRYGQALFNTLLAIRPELAEMIRGTKRDPFHARGASGDPSLYEFGEFINRAFAEAPPGDSPKG